MSAKNASEMTASEITSIVRGRNAGCPIPTVLYHHIGGGYVAADAVEAVAAGGLKALGRWSDINEFLPLRPQGVFFWGPENAGYPGFERVAVQVADLDVSKLWAFPAEWATIANDMAICGRDIYGEAMIEAMAMAMAIPFAEYDGSFAAEYIYQGDIPAALLTWA